jgi:AraC family transcriptional regulator, melibiose operon regulatory protein
MADSSTQHDRAIGFRVWAVEPVASMGAAHTHPDVEINFLRSGEVTYLHGGAVCRVVGAALAVFWGGVPHQTLPPGLRGHGVWITLPLDWFLRWSLPGDLQQRLLAGELVQTPTLAGDVEQFERWIDDFRRRGSARQRVLLLEIEARLHRLAWSAPVLRPRFQSGSAVRRSAPWLESVTAFIARRYTEKVVVADIARAAGLNEKYLMRAFKRHCRMAVWEYVSRLRVAHAQRLLLTTDDKIIDVAFAAGFGSVAAFYQTLNVCGAPTPKDFRARHRGVSERQITSSSRRSRGASGHSRDQSKSP